METLFPIFAESISCKVSGLRQLGPNVSAGQKSRLLESISDDIRKCTDLIPVHVSQAAKSKAEKLKPHIDLFRETWHSQPRFDKGRKIFQYEHVVPVSSVRDSCLQAQDTGDVLKILTTRLKVAWILKTENARLAKLGYAVRRPDPEAAYHQAGIDLIPPTIR